MTPLSLSPSLGPKLWFSKQLSEDHSLYFHKVLWTVKFSYTFTFNLNEYKLFNKPKPSYKTYRNIPVNPQSTHWITRLPSLKQSLSEASMTTTQEKRGLVWFGKCHYG